MYVLDHYLDCKSCKTKKHIVALTGWCRRNAEDEKKNLIFVPQTTKTKTKTKPKTINFLVSKLESKEYSERPEATIASFFFSFKL